MLGVLFKVLSGRTRIEIHVCLAPSSVLPTIMWCLICPWSISVQNTMGYFWVLFSRQYHLILFWKITHPALNRICWVVNALLITEVFRCHMFVSTNVCWTSNLSKGLGGTNKKWWDHSLPQGAFSCRGNNNRKLGIISLYCKKGQKRGNVL